MPLFASIKERLTPEAPVKQPPLLEDWDIIKLSDPATPLFKNDKDQLWRVILGFGLPGGFTLTPTAYLFVQIVDPFTTVNVDSWQMNVAQGGAAPQPVAELQQITVPRRMVIPPTFQLAVSSNPVTSFEFLVVKLTTFSQVKEWL